MDVLKGRDGMLSASQISLKSFRNSLHIQWSTSAKETSPVSDSEGSMHACDGGGGGGGRMLCIEATDLGQHF